MTMAIDNQQRHHLSSLGLDHMPYASAGPHFSNPWAASSAPSSSSQLYPTSFGGYGGLGKQEPARATTMAMSYSSMPATSGNYSGASYSQQDLINPASDLRQPYEQSYSSAPSQNTSYSQASTFPPMNTYGQSLAQSQQEQTRAPAPSVAPAHTAAFGEALDGARGMVAMSQADITPRNIYGPRGDRTSTDSYGFPATHSAQSSISSGSYPSYFGTSIDSSSTDYSSAAESIDSINSRTLPRPNGLMGASLPPAPQSMMGSFNSKISSSTQKRHKCKICDKRFTRPSSLQTHVYSHTGEKPFQCEVTGCGRNFSVVSNLRRHRKVHKESRMGDDNDHGSPEGSWASSSTRD